MLDGAEFRSSGGIRPSFTMTETNVAMYLQGSRARTISRFLGNRSKVEIGGLGAAPPDGRSHTRACRKVRIRRGEVNLVRWFVNYLFASCVSIRKRRKHSARASGAEFD